MLCAIPFICMSQSWLLKNIVLTGTDCRMKYQKSSGVEGDGHSNHQRELGIDHAYQLHGLYRACKEENKKRKAFWKAAGKAFRVGEPGQW